MYGTTEYRIKNGKEEKLIVCYGKGNDNSKDWSSLNERCRNCNKYAYSKFVDDWCAEGDTRVK